MTDRLYDTTKAGELLGGMHYNQVLHLIRSGRLHAKKQVVRKGEGTKDHPRYYVTASEINRYIASLPDAGEPATVEPEKPDRKPAGLRKELESARSYV